MAHPFDPLRVLAALQAHGVQYVLVGGMASAAHGAPIAVGDVDICIPNDTDNLRRVSLALKQLGAEPVGEDARHRSSYTTVAGDLDVIEVGRSFEGLWANGSDENLGKGVVAHVASMADLMELKRRSGDLAVAAQLAALAGERDLDAVEFEPTERHWPAWAERLWTRFEEIDAFLTRTIYGDRHHIRS